MKNFQFSIFNFQLQQGQAALTAVLFFLFISLALIGAFSGLATIELQSARTIIYSKQSYAFGEGVAEDATYRLISGKNMPSSVIYELGTLKATTTVSDAPGTKEITTAVRQNNALRRIKTILSNTIGIAFHYGAQVGEGGLTLSENAGVRGSLYSNGNVVGNNGAFVDGDAFVSRGVAASADQSWTSHDTDFIFGRRVGNQDRIDVGQQFKPSTSAALSKISLYLKKVGSPQTLQIKITEDENDKPDDDDILASLSLSASQVAETYAWIDLVVAEAPTLLSSKKYWIVLDASSDSNNYWVWALDSSDSYSQGTGKWSKDWTKGQWSSSAGDFNFKVWIGGEDNFIDRVTINGSAAAHIVRNSDVGMDVDAFTFDSGAVGGSIHADTLSNCTISGNAEFNTKNNCAVSGAQTSPTVPPSDLEPLDMPISGGVIQQWKDDALAGGTISSGNFSPPAKSTSVIGPGVIYGNIILINQQKVILKGTVWVKGYIDIDNNAEIKLDSSYGAYSGVLLTDSWGHIANNGTFGGSGTVGSYLMLLSTVACKGGAKTSGCTHHNAAVDLHNNISGVIFYASQGLVNLHNNITVTELTAWGVSLDNNSVIEYEQGLSNARFSSGPTGGWYIDNWQEIQ